MTPLRDEEYDALETALGTTARGRLFLAEVGRRQRAADTTMLLDSMARLERVVREDRRSLDAQRIRDDLKDMSGAIERTRREIAAIRPSVGEAGQIEEATEELDATVRATETATTDILEAAERIQESLETLREGGGDAATCDAVETAIMSIFTSCSFQDLTGQRTRKVVQLLRYLEARVEAMIEIWSGGVGSEAETAAISQAPLPTMPVDQRPDAHLLNGPAREGEGISQDTVDSMFLEAPENEPAVAEARGQVETLPVRLAVTGNLALAASAEPAPAAAGSVVDLMQRLEAMTPGERLALFS